MKKSNLIAAALAIAITGWMVTGYFTPESRGETQTGETQTGGTQSPRIPERMTVEVGVQKAESVPRYIVAQGQVEPGRTVTVRAQTTGLIAEVVAQEGQAVKAGDVLVRIKLNDRDARLRKAEALVNERQSTYAATKKLGENGYQSQRRIDETLSALENARADLEIINLEIQNTTIRAPFAGILEKRNVEVGDYVAVNGEVATIVDNNPLVATAQVAQQDIGQIALGKQAEIDLATGQKAQGLVRYIAPRAEETTRTFRIEIEIPNPESRILSGTSAQARIPTGTAQAHFVSPALLTLNDAGVVGIKTVTVENIVSFYPVTIVQAEAGGIWVSGLPDEARIITVGQGFVQDGQSVNTLTSDKQSTALLPRGRMSSIGGQQ